MSALASELAAALARLGISTSEAAERAEIDRTFLVRLLGGGHPPRAKIGRRLADEDMRYRRLRDVLELPDDFVTRVAAMQQETPEVNEVRFLLSEAAMLVWARVCDAIPDDMRAGMLILVNRLFGDAADLDQFPDNFEARVASPQGTQSSAADDGASRRGHDLRRFPTRTGRTLPATAYAGSRGDDSALRGYLGTSPQASHSAVAQCLNRIAAATTDLHRMLRRRPTEFEREAHMRIAAYLYGKASSISARVSAT